MLRARPDMNLIEATLLLLFITTMTVPWARRIGLPTEILLVLGSLVFSLLPGLRPLILDPNVVFELFLPPILFPWPDISPRFGLAFGSRRYPE